MSAAVLTDDEYLDAIDAEALRRGFIEKGQTLVGMTGPEPWLEAWHEDPSLTPADQVQGEIDAALESL